jgi:hypothetical protein
VAAAFAGNDSAFGKRRFHFAVYDDCFVLTPLSVENGLYAAEFLWLSLFPRRISFALRVALDFVRPAKYL